MSNQNDVGEAAGLQEVLPEYVTHGFVAATTIKTFATGNVVRDRHPVAVTKLSDTVADGDHLADQFVAKYGTGRGNASVEFEQVGPTKTHHSETQEHLAGTWERDRSSFQGGFVATKTGYDEVAALPAPIAVRPFRGILLNHGSPVVGRSQDVPLPCMLCYSALLFAQMNVAHAPDSK